LFQKVSFGVGKIQPYSFKTFPKALPCKVFPLRAFFCPYKKPSFAVQADPFTVWWVKLLADQKVGKGLANRRHTLKSGLFTSSDLPLFPWDVEQASNHSTV